MKMPFALSTVGIIATVSVMFGSLVIAAETRELTCEADVVFPKRVCVAEMNGDSPHGTCRAYDERKRLILTE